RASGGRVVSIAIVGRPPLAYINPAGGVVVFTDKLEGRVLLSALVEPIGAALIERTALRQVAQVGRKALDRQQLFVRRLVEARHRLEQPQCVGMPRVRIYVRGRR